MAELAKAGLLALAFAPACAARQAEAEFVGRWRVVELRFEDQQFPFPASVADEDCTKGYAIEVSSDGALGEVRYAYSYDCGDHDEPVYYSLVIPIAVVADAGIVAVGGLDLDWTCASAGWDAWDCARPDGALLVLEPA